MQKSGQEVIEESANSSTEAMRKALIVAVSDYSSNLQPLDFCKKDGEDTYQLLNSLGYEITTNHKLIGHVTYESMREAIIDFFTDINNKAEDTLLFYYSGHGIPDVDGDIYLASSEIDPNAPFRRGFSFNDLTKMIQRSVSIRIVTVLDCCYSGAAKLSKGHEEDAAKLGTVAIDNKANVLQQGEGKCLLAASQAAQEAYALKEGEHSIFTYYLLQGLKGNERSVDAYGNITPYSLGNFIYRSILNLPAKKRPKQKPITKVEASGDIILAYYPDLAKSKTFDSTYTASASQTSSLMLESELIEISYLVLEAPNRESSYPHDTLIQKIASMINVQTMLNNEEIPFIPFNGYESVEDKKKIFLYGRSGCGKSRAMLELIRDALSTSSYDKIYIINPRNNAGQGSANTSLRNLITKITHRDLVLWDNFPDPLIRRDFETALRALEVVSSRETGCSIISLKPEYLEPYRGIGSFLHEFYGMELTYDKEKIMEMIRSRGSTMNQFKNLYHNHVESRLDDISKTLWKKEPFPTAVLGFYVELQKRREMSRKVDAIQVANELSNLSEYYDRQFRFINEHRKNDAHFLFTIKLSYEIELPRTAEYITNLQRKIFGTEPPSDPFPRLGTWIYLSGRFYSMHDGISHAIKLDEYIKLSVIPFVAKNIDSLVRPDFEHRYRLGEFLGENIMHIINESSMHTFEIAEQKREELDLLVKLIPREIYKYMKEGAFEMGFGYGCGEVFSSLEKELRDAILKIARPRKLLGEGLAQSFGKRYPDLNKIEREKVKEMTYSGLPFARHFGESLGRIFFKKLDVDLQIELFSLIEKNDQVADGLGIGIGSVFDSLDDTAKKEVLSIAEKNVTFTRGMGLGFGRTFLTLDEESRAKIVGDIKTNNELGFGFGMGLADTYSKTFMLMSTEANDRVLSIVESDTQVAQGFGCYINQLWFSENEIQLQEQKKMVKLADRNSHFAFGFGVSIAYIIQDYVSQKEQADFHAKISKNLEFARGFGHGIGIGLNLLPEGLKKQQYMMASTNGQFETGLGSGSGTIAVYLTDDFRRELMEKCMISGSFAFGHGYGLAYVFSYLEPAIRCEILIMAEHNLELAQGLGYGFGTVFRYLNNDVQKQIHKMRETNVGLARGFGQGRGAVFPYLNKVLRQGLLGLADTDSEFGFGIGFSLGRVLNDNPSEDLRAEIMSKADNNCRFAEGLGYGLAYVFSYSVNNNKNYNMGTSTLFSKLFNEYGANYALTSGLGIGFGTTFSWLPEDLRAEIMSKADNNCRFAEGLGYGLGYTFKYSDKSEQENIFSIAGSETSLARGLGAGLGSTFLYLSPNLQQEAIAKANLNRQFDFGLGAGLGSIFSYLSKELRSLVHERKEHDEHFARGLGDGLGRTFKYFEESFRKELLEFTRKDHENSLASGLGAGLGSIFSYLSKKDQQQFLLVLSNQNAYFAHGLGEGIGNAFAFVKSELRERLLEEDEFARNEHLARGFGFGLGRTFPSQNDVQELIFSKCIKNSSLASGLGNGLGQNFSSFDRELQEEILQRAELNSSLASGLGNGLAHTFKYLCAEVKTSIIEQARKNTTLYEGLRDILY
jgi:hypothetical protein